MNPSYFRIKRNMEDAVERLCIWNGSSFKERIETDYSKAVDVSLNKNGQWKGDCLYAYENDGWTVFEDLSGGYSFIEPEQWKEFAGTDKLVFASYNDALLYAEMIVIENGSLTKYFVECADMPEENVNEGDGVPGIENWIDVASFVDGDDLVYSDIGVVFIF